MIDWHKYPFSVFCLLCGMPLASVFDLKLGKRPSFYYLIYIYVLIETPLRATRQKSSLTCTMKMLRFAEFAANT